MALKTAGSERANLGVRPVCIGLLTSSIVKMLDLCFLCCHGYLDLSQKHQD